MPLAARKVALWHERRSISRNSSKDPPNRLASAQWNGSMFWDIATNGLNGPA
jgi:hypothetical protein